MVDVFDEDRLLKKASEAMREQWNGDLPENANMADAVFEMLIGSSDMPSPDTLGFSIDDWTSIDPFKLRADWIQNPLMSLLLLRHEGHRALLLNGLCQVLCKEGQGVEYFTSMNVNDPGIAIQLLEKHKVAVEWNDDRHQWLAIESNMAGDTLREASFRHVIAKTYGEDFMLENFN